MPSSFSNPALTNPTFDASNNRMASGQNWTYDSAGNVTGDPEGRTFIYDAENKQVNVATIDENGNPIATVGEYAYDGDGKRVKKIVPGTGETTISVYDASNKLVAEYSTIVEPVATAKTSYLTTDHLGSPRALTDQFGHIISRRDFHPFGDEITSGRSSGQGYVTDDVRQGFTGYERDNESDLDYAGARYCNKNQRKFTGVDPLLSTGSVYNPQTWNRYSYALNTPLEYTDPFGMYICDGDKKQCKNIEDGINKAQDALKKLDPKSDQYRDLARSLNTYGKAGVDNGLTIKFGVTTTGAPAETTGIIREDPKNPGNKLITADNPTGRDLVITFDPKQFRSASDYAGTIAHEGSHAADRTDFIEALPTNLGSETATKMFDSSPLNQTKYETEMRAYGVSAAVARGQGFDSLAIGKNKIEIWNSGWKEADRMKKQTEGINKVLAEPKSKGGLYEITKENPGPRFY